MGYNIYIGKVVGVSNPGDDRLQVRILPHMENTNIPDNKCPLWPYFFKGQTFTSKYGEFIWALADDEFSSGYILGPANYNTLVENKFTSGRVFDRDKNDTNFSIPSELRDNLSNFSVKLIGETLDFVNVQVTYWSDTCIHMTERNTGGFIIAFSNGTMYIMRSDMCLFYVGGSKVMISSKGISMASTEIKMQSESVLLGNNPTANVMITQSSTGAAPISSKYVKA